MHRRNWFSTVRNTSISVGTASSRRDSSTAVTSSTNPANKQVLPCVDQRPFRFTREGREENSPPGLVCRSNHLTDKFTFDLSLVTNIVCSSSALSLSGRRLHTLVTSSFSHRSVADLVFNVYWFAKMLPALRSVLGDSLYNVAMVSFQ